MIQFKYVGDHPDLQGETALGRYSESGHFVVQCTGHGAAYIVSGGSIPCRMVDQIDWACGWHRTPRSDWEFVDQPKFRGTRDECADFVRANRFNLDCNCFHDDTEWVVFGVACCP